MKKSSILALAAFSLFACPMFAEEETTEEPVATETNETTVSLNDEETNENFFALDDGEEENGNTYLAKSDDEDESETVSAV